MQDAHVLLPDLISSITNLPSSRLAYFTVFDGHGGARASQFAAENLHQTLLSKFPKGKKLVRKCLLDTFRQTDEDFLKKASSHVHHPNEPNSDVNRTRVRTKSASVKAPLKADIPPLPEIPGVSRILIVAP
uniref:PPM-type phosphatase domain-containing protein n=1 Tax=Sinocyclocheilus grahami TaxID=75366 RepID=A0A672JTY6_SINGR